MNLKNNKGYVGIDATIAVIIILIIIPIIMGIVYNINKNNNATKREAQALNIAVNAIEASKGINIEELTAKQVVEEINEIYQNTETEGIEEGKASLFINSTKYELTVEVTDYSQINPEATQNIVKMVKVTVKYKIGGEFKDIEISTVIS